MDPGAKMNILHHNRKHGFHVRQNFHTDFLPIGTNMFDKTRGFILDLFVCAIKNYARS